MKPTRLNIRTTIASTFAAIFLVCALAIPSVAVADTYKYSFFFTVPVQVSNLSVYAGYVRLICSVKDANGNFLNKDFSVGPGIVTNDFGQLDSKGNFSGNLTTAIRLANPSEASKAKTYRCEIMAADKTQSSALFNDCSADYGWRCIKQGAPRVLFVEGVIP